MKSVLSLLAVASAAAATASDAQVFIFDPVVPTINAPQINKDVARLILAHRLRDAPDDSGPFVPNTVSAQELDAHIDAYGKPRQPLFSSRRTQREPQLVILVEGATSESFKDVQAALSDTLPSFSIPNPPSQSANNDLLAIDFSEYTGSWAGSNSCPLDLAINPSQDRCWNGDSLIVKYDAMKDPKIVSLLASSIPQLKKWATSGELETTLVFLPESSRDSDVSTWATRGNSKLDRRQQTETVMQFDIKPSETPDTVGANTAPVSSSPVQMFSSTQCFATKEKCLKSTYGCFRHGTCDEFSKGCFKCNCGTTKDKYGIETQWTGGMCQKVDVSTEFWMFFGVGLIALVSVGGALSLLVNVGNEPLPGVLGAGVVKTK